MGTGIGIGRRTRLPAAFPLVVGTMAIDAAAQAAPSPTRRAGSFETTARPVSMHLPRECAADGAPRRPAAP